MLIVIRSLHIWWMSIRRDRFPRLYIIAPRLYSIAPRLYRFQISYQVMFRQSYNYSIGDVLDGGHCYYSWSVHLQ